MPLLADKLLDLLTKQKLVDQMVKNQHASRQDVVEFLLHKQHDVELQNALKGLSAIEIAQVLDELPDDAALALWHKLSPELANDVLWELPPERREFARRIGLLAGPFTLLPCESQSTISWGLPIGGTQILV